MLPKKSTAQLKQLCAMIIGIFKVVLLFDFNNNFGTYILNK